MKWYQKPIWIIVLLVLFFPVGLFLMWKYADWNKYIKWGITGLFALLFIWPWVNYALAETPAIVLSEFEVAEKTVTGSEYKLSGKVTPPSTELKVNGEVVEVKEDGSFTYTLSLKEGVNEIKIEANNSGKTAELVRKLTRELTAEEKAAEKAAKEAEAKKKAEEEAAKAAAKKAESKKKAEEEAKRKAEEEAKKKAEEEASKNLDEFPKKLEDYLNNTWDEIPGTTYKVYWWDTWEGVDSGKNDLVVEPSFEPSEKQCQRIAQVATIDRVQLTGRKEGVVHIVAYDNSKDYCKLRT